MPTTYLTLTGVVVATIAAMLIGSVWYSPLLFVKPWLRAIGKSESQMKGSMSQAMILGTIVTLIGNVAIAIVLSYVDPISMQEALTFTLVAWVAFIVPLASYSFIYEQKPLSLFFINAGHLLVASEFVVAVLYYFG